MRSLTVRPGIWYELQGAVSELQRHASVRRADSRVELARVDRVDRVDGRTHAGREVPFTAFERRSSDANHNYPGRLTDDPLQFVPNS